MIGQTGFEQVLYFDKFAIFSDNWWPLLTLSGSHVLGQVPASRLDFTAIQLSRMNGTEKEFQKR